MFTKEERSTFPYWFAHWCAFNMTALNLHAWKFKYLFHDIEKPWLRLFMPYEKVQHWHRNHNKHHMEWLHRYNTKHDYKKFDWEAMMIDWECSRFTKETCSRNAREELKYQVELFDENNDEDIWKRYLLISEGLKALSKLGL